MRVMELSMKDIGTNEQSHHKHLRSSVLIGIKPECLVVSSFSKLIIRTYRFAVPELFACKWLQY